MINGESLSPNSVENKINPINTVEDPKRHWPYHNWYRNLVHRSTNSQEEQLRRLEAAEQLEVVVIPTFQHYEVQREIWDSGRGKNVSDGISSGWALVNEPKVILEGRILPSFDYVRRWPKPDQAIQFILRHLEECPTVWEHLQLSAASALGYKLHSPDSVGRNTGTLIMDDEINDWVWKANDPDNQQNYLYSVVYQTNPPIEIGFNSKSEIYQTASGKTILMPKWYYHEGYFHEALREAERLEAEQKKERNRQVLLIELKRRALEDLGIDEVALDELTYGTEDGLRSLFTKEELKKISDEVGLS